jgi:colanic acid biosynthesis glycosyl transferase WcaI
MGPMSANLPHSLPNLLFVNRTYPPDHGATAFRLYELTDDLATHGYPITALVAKGRNQPLSALPTGLKVQRLKIGHNPKPHWREQVALVKAFTMRLLFAKQAQIIITLTDPALLVAAAAFAHKLRPRQGQKLVHWCHEVLPDLYPAQGTKMPRWWLRFLQKLYLWSLKQHHALVVIGQDMANFWIARGVPVEKIHVIPNWPDASVVTTANRYRDTNDNPFANADMFTVLNSGNFGGAYEFDSFLAAIPLVQAVTQARVRFVFAGEGAQWEAVKTKVEANLWPNVEFLRTQPADKFMELLRAGDLHVGTMKPSARGLIAPSKINSAFGVGRPVLFVGPHDSHHGQMIQTFQAGAVIDPQQPQAAEQIAAAILYYATNKEAHNQACANAKVAAQSIDLVNNASPKFRALFKQLSTAD